MAVVHIWSFFWKLLAPFMLQQKDCLVKPSVYGESFGSRW